MAEQSFSTAWYAEPGVFGGERRHQRVDDVELALALHGRTITRKSRNWPAIHRLQHAKLLRVEVISRHVAMLHPPRPGWIGRDCVGECSDPGSRHCRCWVVHLREAGTP